MTYHHHHHGRRQKKQHVLWLEENDRVRDDGRGVGVVGVGIQSETRRGRGGVFGNVRRRIGRMGEIGSRAIHGCVVVSFLFLLLLLLLLLSVCFLRVFSRARREFVWRFLRLERVLNRSKSRGKDCGASCIKKKSDRKKSDLDVGLSRIIGPTKPPRASQKVTMDHRAKSIDRRVPMTQQSSNEYACPCFFLCVCAQKRVRFQSSGVFFVRGLTKSDTPFSSLCL